MPQTTEIKICEQDKRLYSMFEDRVRSKWVSVGFAISVLQLEVVDKDYFNSVGKDRFIESVKK